MSLVTAPLAMLVGSLLLSGGLAATSEIGLISEREKATISAGQNPPNYTCFQVIALQCSAFDNFGNLTPCGRAQVPNCTNDGYCPHNCSVTDTASWQCPGTGKTSGTGQCPALSGNPGGSTCGVTWSGGLCIGTAAKGCYCSGGAADTPQVVCGAINTTEPTVVNQA